MNNMKGRAIANAIKMARATGKQMQVVIGSRDGTYEIYPATAKLSPLHTLVFETEKGGDRNVMQTQLL